MIYCVEDDDNIRELVIYTLETTGLKAKGFADGAAFMEALAFDTPELILLDIMLPDEDGLSILRRLQEDERYKAVPVILATAKGSEFDKVKGLDSGADDYMAKPFGMLEMVSRVKAVLRRCRQQVPSGGGEISRGPLHVNLRQHQVEVAGVKAPLTLKEYELLKKLLLHPGIVFSRDQLLNDIWGYEFSGETRTVDVHIRTLRQKLGAAGEFIETVRGVGYRLAGK